MHAEFLTAFSPSRLPCLCCALRGFFQVGEDFNSVAFRLHLWEDVLDFAIRTDDEGGASDAHDFFAIHIFLLDNAVGFSDFFVGIGEEGKWQLELLPKFLLGFGCVG